MSIYVFPLVFSLPQKRTIFEKYDMFLCFYLRFSICSNHIKHGSYVIGYVKVERHVKLDFDFIDFIG